MSAVKIYKFPVHGDGRVSQIKCGRVKLLDIQLQNNQMVCWVETRDDFPVTTTELIAFGTGWPVPVELIEKMRYFKTVQDAYGFVWHFYEVPEGVL